MFFLRYFSTLHHLLCSPPLSFASLIASSNSIRLNYLPIKWNLELIWNIPTQWSNVEYYPLSRSPFHTTLRHYLEKYWHWVVTRFTESNSTLYYLSCSSLMPQPTYTSSSMFPLLLYSILGFNLPGYTSNYAPCASNHFCYIYA